MAQLEQHHEIPTSREIITHDSNAKNNEDSMVEVDHIADSTLQTSSKDIPNLQLVHVQVSENKDKVSEENREAFSTKETQEGCEATYVMTKGKTIQSKDHITEGVEETKGISSSIGCF